MSEGGAVLTFVLSLSLFLPRTHTRICHIMSGACTYVFPGSFSFCTSQKSLLHPRTLTTSNPQKLKLGCIRTRLGGSVKGATCGVSDPESICRSSRSPRRVEGTMWCQNKMGLQQMRQALNKTRASALCFKSFSPLESFRNGMITSCRVTT